MHRPAHLQPLTDDRYTSRVGYLRIFSSDQGCFEHRAPLVRLRELDRAYWNMCNGTSATVLWEMNKTYIARLTTSYLIFQSIMPTVTSRFFFQPVILLDFQIFHLTYCLVGAINLQQTKRATCYRFEAPFFRIVHSNGEMVDDWSIHRGEYSVSN